MDSINKDCYKPIIELNTIHSYFVSVYTVSLHAMQKFKV